MKLSKEQFTSLAPYEPYFHTAVHSDWARHPGLHALQTIHGVYRTLCHNARPLNAGCQHCILTLLKDVGTIYFADKEEIINAKNDALLVEDYKKVKRTRKKKTE